jgi:hypothetical protein
MPQPENMNLPPPNPDPLVEALSALKPAAADLNRDGLMYAAGAESRRGVVRLWQAAAGFLAAVGFAAGMFFRPGGIERVVYVEVPAPASALPTPEPQLAPEPSPAVAPLTHHPARPTSYGRAWLQFRSDLLSLGLSFLPHPGLPPTHDEKPN